MCPEVLEACKHCSLQVKRSATKSHVESECNEAPLNCEYGKCSWTVRLCTFDLILICFDLAFFLLRSGSS